MAKEILIYSEVTDKLSADFITSVNELDSNDDLVVRLNTPGGSVDSGFGMIAKFREFKGTKTVKVDGKADSMGLFFLAYADNVEALDVSTFILHRAAFPSWFESSDFFTDDKKALLDSANENLRSAFESKIDLDKFKQIKGVTLDDVFSMDSRINIFLSADEAKEIGLVDKVVKITPERSSLIAAAYSDMRLNMTSNGVTESISNNNSNIDKMTINDLKKNHPSVYNEIFALGEAAAISAEQDRIGAWMTFVDIDSEAVSKGIKSGESISQTVMAELTRKQFSAESIVEIEEDSVDDVEPADNNGTEEATAKSDFMNELEKTIKIK